LRPGWSHRNVPGGATGLLVVILSNVLWVVWGWYARAYALIVLQICLVILNLRGAKKNDPEKTVTADA
jgi:hypothetical protein